MGKTNKKTGYSCIEEKFGKKESLKEKIKRSLRNVKYVYQRAKYGYCDSDVWSIDYWFLRVMPGMLQQLKDTTDSYPDFPEMTSHAVYRTGRPKDVEDEGMAKWQDVLQEMIFLLREANEETCTRENRYEHEYDEATHRFEEKYGSLGEKLKTKEDMEREKTEGFIKCLCLEMYQSLKIFQIDTMKNMPLSMNTEISARTKHLSCLENGFGISGTRLFNYALNENGGKQG